jgi:pyrophosphate--fructose-6-phosphate 1-phosphotransferase
LDGQCGVVGMDEEKNGELGLIDFKRIKGGKPFNVDQRWFNELLAEMGQPK